MKITRAIGVAVLTALFVACGGAAVEVPPDTAISADSGGADSGTTADADAFVGTRVMLLGTIGGRHVGSRLYPLDSVTAVLQAFDPDVVLVDLRPGWVESAVIGDEPAYFPTQRVDISEAVFPYRLELGFELRGISGWTAEADAALEAYDEQYPRGPMEREYVMSTARLRAAELSEEHWHDPSWLHGEEYMELSGAAERWLSYYAEETMGEAGPMRVNSRTVGNINDILDEDAADRVLIIVRASQLYFVEAALRVRGDVQLVDPVPFILNAVD